MAGYIVQEVDEIPIYICDDIETEFYHKLYNQKKRFSKVLKQFTNIWYETFKQMLFISNNTDVNDFMSNIYKLFFMTYKYKIDYYSIQNTMTRKNKNYKKKKLLKIKNSIRI